jgi:hypothetical protein
MRTIDLTFSVYDDIMIKAVKKYQENHIEMNRAASAPIKKNQSKKCIESQQHRIKSITLKIIE